MNIIRRIAANSGWVLADKIVTGIISFLLVIYIARYLGPENFGNYNFVFEYVSFFMIFAYLGIDTLLVREISKGSKKSNAMINNSLVLKFLLSTFATILAIAVIWLLPYSSSVKLGTVFAAIGLFAGVPTTVSVFFQAKLKMQYQFIANLISRIALAGLIWYVVTQDGGFIMLIIATVCANLLLGGLLFLFAKPYFKLDFKLNKKLVKYILKESWPLALAVFFVSVYYRIDVVMLSLMRTSAEIGYYSAVYKLTEALHMFPVAFMMSMFPLFSQYFKKNKKAFNKSYQLSIKYLIMLAVPMAVGTSLLANRIIPLFYGQDYIPSIAALTVLIWAEALIFTSAASWHALLAAGKQKKCMIITASCAVINILLNLAIIPIFGFVGAAATTVATEVCFFAIIQRYIPKKIWKQTVSVLLKIVLCSALMGIYVYFLPFNLFVIVATAAVLYFVLMYIIKGIGKEDFVLLKKLFVK